MTQTYCAHALICTIKHERFQIWCCMGKKLSGETLYIKFLNEWIFEQLRWSIPSGSNSVWSQADSNGSKVHTHSTAPANMALGQQSSSQHNESAAQALLDSSGAQPHQLQKKQLLVQIVTHGHFVTEHVDAAMRLFHASTHCITNNCKLCHASCYGMLCHAML